MIASLTSGRSTGNHPVLNTEEFLNTGVLTDVIFTNKQSSNHNLSEEKKKKPPESLRQSL